MANLSWISSNPDYINQMIRNTQVTLSNNYNDLDNIPIIKITSTTNNPQKIWELKEGLYMIDGVAQVDNNTSYEVSNLLISMTARLENGKYILSAFIPYLRGLFEYILKTNSTEYEQHQKIVLMIKNDTLALDNETIYTPIEDYHPATKKYVDDKANEVITELDKMGVNKENLESLSKENRIRDIKLQALLSETSDRNITIEENVRYFDMPLSIDNGIVTINEIVGETLVNVCDQEESVAITKSYTVENENHIALQGEYDGSCRPVVHGNTLVNHNADWDGNLQTGVETSASGIEDVQVEGIKGQEVSVVVEGNTVLNHALGKTSAVVSSIESENNGNYVDLTVANDMSSVVEIEGRTLVNVCDQKDPIAITKSYTVENSGNHIALQGEYDGSCRPVIQGNTMVNLDTHGVIDINFDENSERYINFFINNIELYKPSTTYTIILDVYENTNTQLIVGEINPNHILTSVYLANAIQSSSGTKGRFIDVVTTPDDISGYTSVLRNYINNNYGEGHIKYSVMIFEGDLTQTPELIPTEYVEGLKSSFEDKKLENVLSSEVITESNIGIHARFTTKQLTKFTVMLPSSISYCNCSIWYSQGGWSRNIKVLPGVNYIEVLESEYLDAITVDTGNFSSDEFRDSDILVLEGDWTHLTEEDFNHLVKYKVEYKVTGKNKLYKVVQGSFYQSDIYYDENGVQFHCGEGLVRKGVTYTTNFGLEEKGYAVLLDNNRRFVEHYFIIGDNPTITPSQDGYLLLRSQSGIGDTKFDATELQLEEGTTPTEYEPYKSYTKTFYLNSPLLEGDTIEDINGVATHVKRYGKVVLDGSEVWDNHQENESYISFIKNDYLWKGELNKVFCDKFLYRKWDGNISEYVWSATHSCGIYISKSKLPSVDVNGFKQWLQQNPTTVVYELTSPVYEPISNEPILCDSYVNGHLDFDSAVPIEKVKFNGTSYNMKYLHPSTNYTVQFESDNEGKLDKDYLSNTQYSSMNIVKGLNKFNITTPSTMTHTYLGLQGIGFNASNIVVTEAIDADFDYFEGLSSTYESCYPGGKNLFNKNNIERIRFATGTNVTVGEEAIIGNLSGQHQFAILELPKGTYTWSVPGGTYFPSEWSMAVYECDTKSISVGTTLKQIGKVYFIGNATKTTFTCQKKYQFVQLAYMQDDLTDETILGAIQIEEGSTATSYEPFIDKYRVDVKVTGKNLLANKYKVEGYLAGGYGDNVTKVNLYKGSDAVSYIIPCKPNTEYILDNGDGNRGNLAFSSDYPKHDIFLYSTTNGRITTDNNAKWLMVYVNSSWVDTDLNCQLEEGAEVTSYEPYQEYTKTFYLNSPLLEGDKIVTKNGKVYHYHKMGKVVLDGSKDWDMSNNLDETCRFSIRLPIDSKGTMDTTDSIRGYSISNNFLCDHDTTYDRDKECYQIGWSTIGSIYIRIFKSKLSTLDVDGFKQWLSKNPTTVVYELASPYYELIDEYNNTILNIPKNIAHLTHTSAVPVNNTVFTNYKDELNVLEANTQYRVMFDIDKANIPFTVTLGGTSQTVTSKKGTHSLLITTPSTLVDKNLVIDGIGRCGIDNIRIFKGNVEYDYVKGLWSGYEERKLENLAGNTVSGNISQYLTLVYHNGKLKKNTTYTIIVKNNSEDLLSFYTNEHIFKDYMSRRTNRDGNYIVFSNTTKNVDDFNAEGFNVILKADTNLVNVDFTCVMLEGDWTDNPPTYEEVMANEGKYAVKVKLDTNATIFGKGGRL